nr:uncharacterized protein LOC109158536 [Ipomoea batatas]
MVRARCPVTGLRTLMQGAHPGSKVPGYRSSDLNGESKVLTPGARCPVTGLRTLLDPRKVGVVDRYLQGCPNVILHGLSATVEGPGAELVHQVLPDRSPRDGGEDGFSGLLPSTDVTGEQDGIGEDLFSQIRAFQDPSPVDHPLVFSGGGAAAQILDSRAAGGSSPCFISTDSTSITEVVDPDPSRRERFAGATSSTSVPDLNEPREPASGSGGLTATVTAALWGVYFSESNSARQHWKSPVDEAFNGTMKSQVEHTTLFGTEKGKEILAHNPMAVSGSKRGDGTEGSNEAEDDITEVVLVEQKRRRVVDEIDGTGKSSNMELFDGAKACSLTCPYSDHLPLLLTPVATLHGTRRRRFCFDNMWLREDKCREIIVNSWSRTVGLDVFDRIEVCGQDIWKWGRTYNSEFQRQIDACKSRLEYLRIRRDEQGFREYTYTENKLLALLNQQNIYWKQRAKEHWYKGGDLNTKYFHNAVKTRRRRNRIRRLRRDDGTVVESLEEMSGIIVDYFNGLFTSTDCEFEEVLDCVSARLNPMENSRLL